MFETVQPNFENAREVKGRQFSYFFTNSVDEFTLKTEY